MLDATERVEFKTLVLTWKAIGIAEPKYLREILPEPRKIEGLRSEGDKAGLGLPNNSPKGMENCRFYHTGQKFNKLPKEIRNEKSLDVFFIKNESKRFYSICDDVSEIKESCFTLK